MKVLEFEGEFDEEDEIPLIEIPTKFQEIPKKDTKESVFKAKISELKFYSISRSENQLQIFDQIDNLKYSLASQEILELKHAVNLQI